MKNNESGFVLLSIITASTLLVAGSFIAFSYKRIIDKETRNANIRHGAYLMEDVIRTHVKLAGKNPDRTLTAQVVRNNIISDIENFSNPAHPTYLKIPIPGTQCNGSPCHVYLKSVRFVDANGLTVSKNSPAAIQAIYEVKAEELNTLGIPSVKTRGGGIKEIPITIPSLTEISSSVALTLGTLICPLSSPVFLGTETIKSRNSYQLKAKCGNIPSASNSSVSCASQGNGKCTRTKISCDVNNGYWLTGLSSNLSPLCQRFPAGTGATSVSFDLCSSDQITKGFKFNKKFEITDVVCQDKGGPYDFD